MGRFYQLSFYLLLVSVSYGKNSQPPTHSTAAYVPTGESNTISNTFSSINSDTTSLILSWKTDLPGTSDDQSITIPIDPNRAYQYDVDWNDDGIFDELGITDSVHHNFGTPGTYTIRIRGNFPRILFRDAGDREKLIDVAQWGTQQWSTMANAFRGCSHLNFSATDAPDLSQVRNLESMLFACTAFNSPIGHWEVSQVESLYFTFGNCVHFNQALNDWDVSSVTNLQRTFIGCTVFNQALDRWEVGQVRSFSAMFNNCKAFNQDIGNWDVSSAIHLSMMFAGASSFNQDIGAWQLDNVQRIHTMFYGAASFNQYIGDWDVSRVANFGSVFRQATSFNQDLRKWDLSQATNMSWMFANAANFNQDIGNWEVSRVENMSYLFFYASSFNQDIGDWEVSAVSDMSNMFKGPNMAFNQDIGDWDVGNVRVTNAMFEHNPSFDQNLGRWPVGALESARRMFNQSELSTPHYDSLLIGWAARDLRDSVDFHAGTSRYCAAWEARAHLLADHGWLITDRGPERDAPLALCRDTTLYLPPSGSLYIEPSWLDAGSFDHCTPLDLWVSQSQFDCNDIGIHYDTLFALDQNGNQSTCVSQITIEDTPFALQCPPDITVTANAPGCTAVVHWLSPTGFCTNSVTSTPPSGATFPLGSTEVHYTAINALADTSRCSFTVTVRNTLSAEVDSLRHPDCTQSPEGQVFLQAIGGTPPYAFDWSHDGQGDWDDPEDQDGLVAGVHQISIRDFNGCTFSNEILLYPTELQIDNCPSDLVLKARLADCSAVATWEPPREVCSGLTLQATHASGDTFALGTTWVTYTVTNDWGQSATCSFSVRVENDLEILPEEVVDPSCWGTSDGALRIGLRGGSGDYAIDWEYDGYGDYDDVPHLENLPAGTYRVRIRDGAACSREDSLVLRTPDSLTTELLVPDLPLCAGARTGRLAVEVSGGTAPYTYQWERAAGGERYVRSTLEELPAGEYWLHVSDSRGCLRRDTVVLSALDSLRLSALPEGNGADRRIDLEVTGGQGPYRFDWDTDGTGDYDDPEDIVAVAAGTYTIRVQDEYGCTASLDLVLRAEGSDCDFTELTLFPNPSLGTFFLALTDCEAPQRIEVYDALGRSVYAADEPDPEEGIHLWGQAGETYWVVIYTAEERLVRSLSLLRD
ncbi:MAG: BspA family leucine-rich repeat surface protein [Bacteroidota bacterium]